MVTTTTTIARQTAPTQLRQQPTARRQSSVRQADKLTAQAGTAQLRVAIRDHFRASEAWAAGGRIGEPPVLGIKASAGIGKTDAVLQELARPEWRSKRVLMLEPSIPLCEEVATRARAHGVDARVIRGRSQPQPGQPKGGTRMCAKYELAEGLSALSVSVTATLCKSKAEGDQPAEECPFAAACPYLAQLANKKPGLLLAAHQYISLTVEGLKAESIDLVVVDESFWQSMTRQGTVSVSQFQRPRYTGEKGSRPRKGESKSQGAQRIAEQDGDFGQMLSDMRRILHDHLDGTPLTLDSFRRVGITADACRFAQGIEFSRLGTPDIRAGMTADEQAERIQAARIEEAYGFARVWKILAAELEHPRSQLIGIVRNPSRYNAKSGAYEDVLETFYHPGTRLSGVPLVLIDADLDEAIAAQFYPVAGRVVSLDVAWSNVRVRQVVDRSVSRSMLAGSNPRQDEQQRNSNRRDDLWTIMQDMAERHGHRLSLSADRSQDAADRARRPVLISYKAVEDAWSDEGRIEQADATDTPQRNALNFDIAHLGDIRGKDGWKDATGIVVAGRLEPTVRATEALARAVFYADAGTLDFVDAPKDEQPRYTVTRRPIMFRDGTEEMVDVSAHPDARIDAVLRQVREAEVLQALSRIRPVHRGPGAPCEVVVATSIPLPGLLVDEAVQWADLVPDRIRMMSVAGVVPDLAADCAAAYPALFASPAAVRQARSRSARAAHAGSNEALAGCDKPHLESLNGKRHTLSGYVRVQYMRLVSGGNRKGSAQVRHHHGESPQTVAGRLSAALPDATDIQVIDPLPADASDEERTDAIAAAVAWLEPWLDTDDVGPVRGQPEAQGGHGGVWRVPGASAVIHGGGSFLPH